jgi:hypothetical protein
MWVTSCRTAKLKNYERIKIPQITKCVEYEQNSREHTSRISPDRIPKQIFLTEKEQSFRRPL